MQELTTVTKTDMLNSLPKCLKQEILNYNYNLGDTTLLSDWKPKTEYSETTQKAALDAIKTLDRYTGSADKKELTQWLSLLGILSAGKDTVSDSKAKTAAYAYMLQDYPSWVFSKETLDECLKKNKFINYQDICEVLDGKLRERETLRYRLKVIATTKPIEKQEESRPTEEDKARVYQMIKDYLEKSGNTTKRF